MIAPPKYELRNPRGSLLADALSSGASRFTYAWSGNSERTSVVLPLWRGPVSVNTGNCSADLNKFKPRFLLIITRIRHARGFDQFPRYVYNINDETRTHWEKTWQYDCAVAVLDIVNSNNFTYYSVYNNDTFQINVAYST